MRAADPGIELSPEQARAAEAGLKPMIPINGRPFLDYVLSSLADAGVRDVALVVAPDHQSIHAYYASDAPPTRVRVTFVVQEDALGTANAILAAEGWTDGQPFLAMNADNLYPRQALADLVALEEPGLPAFEPTDLIASSNIPPERIRAFAILEVTDDGYLKSIVEKPAEQSLRRDDPRVLISMNCWRFDARIFDACRRVPRSARGEYELPEAVGLAIRVGVPFRALRASGPVLDLSRRADMSAVARQLTSVVARP